MLYMAYIERAKLIKHFANSQIIYSIYIYFSVAHSSIGTIHYNNVNIFCCHSLSNRVHLERNFKTVNVERVYHHRIVSANQILWIIFMRRNIKKNKSRKIDSVNLICSKSLMRITHMTSEILMKRTTRKT